MGLRLGRAPLVSELTEPAKGRALDPRRRGRLLDREILTGLIERLDHTIAERWLKDLRAAAPADSTPLAVAELMLAIAHQDYRRGAALADRLASAGVRDAIAGTSEIAAALMSWCYSSVDRLDDTRRVIAIAPPGPFIAAIKYAQRLVDRARESPRPPLTGGPQDATVLVTDAMLGRLAELTTIAGPRWLDAFSTGWRMVALRATGHTREALGLYHAALAAGMSDITIADAPSVLLDAGRVDEALDVTLRARAVFDAGGRVWEGFLNRIAEAKLRLRGAHDPATARLVLDEAERTDSARTMSSISEWIDTWYGLALLMQGDDEAVLVRLRRAVEGMLAGDRILELPTAGVYLAEAEWRAGNEEAGRCRRRPRARRLAPPRVEPHAAAGAR